MRIKRLILAGAMSAFLASAVAQASELTLDASSRESLIESSQVMLESASTEEQGLFLTAVDVVSIHNALAVLKNEYTEAERETMDLSMLSKEDGDKVIERTRHDLNGKSIKQVVDLASSPDYLEARMTVAMISEQMRVQDEQMPVPPAN